MQINEYLLDLLKSKLIPVETFLQHTTLPFGKQILSEIQSLKEQQQGTEGGGVNMAAVQNIQDIAAKQSDPRAVELLQKMVSGAVPNAPTPEMPAVQE